ncbi:MAG: hypothetical protein GJU76_14535 [Gallionella sp.]|jgi:hypothetical protein|nr:hypothetical protein [Gallionella sp.]
MTALKTDSTFDWNHLTLIDEGKPSVPEPVLVPPKKEESEFNPSLNLFDYILPGRRSRKEEEASARYHEYLLQWEGRYSPRPLSGCPASRGHLSCAEF